MFQNQIQYIELHHYTILYEWPRWSGQRTYLLHLQYCFLKRIFYYWNEPPLATIDSFIMKIS